MSVGSLLDTNVLVYLLDGTDLNKYQLASLLVEAGVRRGECGITQQVINETLNVAVTKLDFSRDEATDFLEKTCLGS